MQTVFPLYAEYALLMWNRSLVLIDYKYDLSMMIDDILGLIQAVAVDPEGKVVTAWPSNTFAAVWTTQWNRVSVDAIWHNVSGSPESDLNAKPRVIVARTDFLREWRQPLEIIERALVAAGYTAETLDGMDRLHRTIGMIDGYGQLYRD